MAKGDQKTINGVWLEASRVPGIPQVDYDRYMAELEGMEYNEAEAIQLIEALQFIAAGFADLAWRSSATQTACGKGTSPSTNLPKSAADMLKSSVKPKQKPTRNNGSDMPLAGSR
ncbi:hypothetical protein [Kordiimonas aquimaris]|uniref:hypothetical protein n=1 Tax=Kordiimonas aquimaris TaxID=707591 RepID=UPI0021D24CDB|nr:hypothetical protein [Kordiimonas aquimaris]